MQADRAEVEAERSYPTNFRPLNTIQSSFCITNNTFNRHPVHLQPTPHRPATAAPPVKESSAMRKSKWIKIILLIMCLIVGLKKGGKDSLFMNYNELRWMLLVAIGDCFEE